jgi:hypothetical protein
VVAFWDETFSSNLGNAGSGGLEVKVIIRVANASYSNPRMAKMLMFFHLSTGNRSGQAYCKDCDRLFTLRLDE